MRLAAIDIGTNSVHMALMEAQGERSLQVLDKEKRMVRLGRGLFGNNQLTKRAFREGLDAVRHSTRLAENAGASKILIVATSATREASNGGQFLRQVHKQTGVRPRVITGTEEARLIFRAARGAVELGKGNALVLDIGGGSVEMVVGDQKTIHVSESLRLGVQRLLERQATEGPLSSKDVHELRGYIQGVAGAAVAEAKALGFSRLIGTSGTIKTLGEAAHLMAGGSEWRSVNAQTVPLKQLAKLTEKLCAMDLDERMKVDGVDTDRADCIHLGAVLLTELMDMMDQKSVTLCEASLREGVLLDYLDRNGYIEQRDPGADVRRRSVAELARRYERDDPHEHHVAHLALQLFDETQSLHDHGHEARDILEFAALLHDVGNQISFRKRHKHSLYIIRHSEMAGFPDREVELVANVARYHRRAHPKKKKHARYKRLDKSDRRLVKTLAGLLRVAKGLDRGQSQGVKGLRCHLDEETVRLVVRGAGELDLELQSARRRTDLLEKALKRSVKVERD